MPTAKLIDNQNSVEYVLKDSVTRLGRGQDNDIVIRSRLVSRYHLEFRRKLTGYFVADVGSTHGYYVNDVRARGEVKLKNGDRIRVLIVYADDKDPGTKDSKGHGSSTISTRIQAVAKPQLEGDENNLNVGCDLTFQVDGKMFFEKVAEMIGKKP